MRMRSRCLLYLEVEHVCTPKPSTKESIAHIMSSRLRHTTHACRLQRIQVPKYHRFLNEWDLLDGDPLRPFNNFWVIRVPVIFPWLGQSLPFVFIMGEAEHLSWNIRVYGWRHEFSQRWIMLSQSLTFTVCFDIVPIGLDGPAAPETHIWYSSIWYENVRTSDQLFVGVLLQIQPRATRESLVVPFPVGSNFSARRLAYLSQGLHFQACRTLSQTKRTPHATDFWTLWSWGITDLASSKWL